MSPFVPFLGPDTVTVTDGRVKIADKGYARVSYEGTHCCDWAWHVRGASCDAPATWVYGVLWWYPGRGWQTRTHYRCHTHEPHGSYQLRNNRLP